MISLGIRITPKLIRYAILEMVNDNIRFVNADSENLIIFPKYCNKIEDKIKWTYNEIERIYRKYPEITAISIKEDEIQVRKTSASREKAYISGAIFLFASQKGIMIKPLINKQIGTRTEDVKDDAEKIVNPSSNKWDAEIAAAVCSAAKIER